jgi:very-short-patch-repair endonuclease
MAEKIRGVSKSSSKETAAGKHQDSLVRDAFEVSIESAQIVNYAAAQNNIPLISRLVIRNTTERLYKQVEVLISANPALFDPKRFTFDTFGGHETRTFNSVQLNLALNHEYLFDLDESECASISVRVTKDEMEPKLHNEPIRALARNEWGATLGLPELLAAHVQPTTIEIDRVLSAASNLLKSSAGIAMDGYRSKNREYVWKQVNAIYQTLTNMGFQYAPPPASFEKTGQKIRTAAQILDGKVMTCLDSSVLLAACLEQAGLNPVILLKEGHAWVGVWLVDSCFANSVEDCAQDVRKRMASGEFLTFETTVITQAGSMKKARADAANYLDEAQESTFKYAIDIKRARQNHIRPMRTSPSLANRPSDSNIDLLSGPALEDMPELPPLDPSVIEVTEMVTDQTPEGRLEKWKARLLDLTLRNRLLNFKPSKKFLRLITHDIGKLEDALAAGGEFKLVAKRSLSDSGDPRSEEEFKAKHGMTSAEQHAMSVLPRKEICFDVEKDKLQDYATIIFREAKNVLDETGANSLFMALGSLCWKETPEAETVLKAPIIMVPVKLKRGAVGAGIRLERLDEETVFNPTLIQKLAISFDISLPYVDGQLPRDESGVDVGKIFATLRKKVEDLKGFEVIEDSYLGLYSFTKYLMWSDLARNSQDLLNNKVVNHLLNHHGEYFQEDIETVRPEDLDRDYLPQSLFTPLLADSSQLAVICTAAKGRNMVVEGPPGTGKSQTITNLIAHFLANGKTVLFVAEKMAALEVVHKRLTEIGLDEFCLELHSTKAKKSEISKQFVQVLDGATDQIVANWDREAERLATRRSELNSLVSVLHRAHRNGLSVYKAMGLTLTSDRELAKFDWADSDVHDCNQKVALEDFVGELAALVARLSKIARHPLNEIKRTSWTPHWQDNLFATAMQCSEEVANIEASLADLAQVVTVNPKIASLNQLQSIDDLADSLLRASQVPVECANQMFSAPERKKLLEIISHGQTRSLLWEKFKDYDPELKVLDAVTMNLQWKSAIQDWWPKSWFSKRKISNQILLYSLNRRRVADEDMELFLGNLAKLNLEDRFLQVNAGAGTAGFGDNFKGENTDWNKATATLRWMEETAQALQKAFDTQMEQLDAARTSLRLNLTNQNESFAPGGRLYNIAIAYRKAYAAFSTAFSSLKEVSGNPDFLGGPAQPGILERILIARAQWKSCTKEIQPWCVWNEFQSQASSMGLHGLVDQVRQGVVDLSDLKEHFVVSYASWWLKRILDKEPLLANFSGASQAYKIKEFQKADMRFQELTQHYIQAKLRGRIPTGKELTGELKDEAGFLRHESQKQKMHKPVRDVLNRTAAVLPRLKPCLLMSPLSVAQYLDSKNHTFDLVIFDEASQIATWDAVGAISRGKQLICVGDPKQLPPTNFFSASDASGEYEEESLVEMESVLDECLSCGMHSSRLMWHYRSRNEGLITFSNHRYYNSSLVTFPSPVERDNSVEFVDSKGIYEPGTSRINKIEAAKIVDEIERHYLAGEGDRYSIGVITFNTTQKALIEKLLDAKRLSNRALDEAIAQATSEELFIKNLENVQGDERDVILFSITFARDAAGRLSMNFGPMNKEGGERRLNVAATRARHKVKVFSSLRPEDIDLSRTKAAGVADLKAYLDFALHGARAIATEATLTGLEPDSPFEVQVIEALRSHNWRVVPQVGVSGYRIDIAVINPHAPGEFLLGVECDGATYHSAPSARDRDRLRQLILEELGWNIHRIWSTDWWLNRKIPMETLLTRLEKLETKARKKAHKDSGST